MFATFSKKYAQFQLKFILRFRFFSVEKKEMKKGVEVYFPTNNKLNGFYWTYLEESLKVLGYVTRKIGFSGTLYSKDEDS